MDLLYRILNSLKALASLVGAIATALSLVYTDNEALTVVAIIATAVVTWAVPNLDPLGKYQSQSVQPPEGTDEDADDGLTYEEAGGLPYEFGDNAFDDGLPGSPGGAPDRY